MKTPTIREFNERFPTDDACLEHLMRTRYGATHVCAKCNREARYYRVKTRRCYECEHCGTQVYPTAGTPFENTRTSLKDWFFVMFLFCASRNGVAAKEVQRQIGVTYKTAWRMCNLIRQYMGYVDGDAPLGGNGSPVEVDELFLGGRDKVGEGDKMIVFGMVERGGEAVTRGLQTGAERPRRPRAEEPVLGGVGVRPDDGRANGRVPAWGYRHSTVNHAAKEWVREGVHTNSIESMWSILRRGINGTYIHVSPKHLQTYLWEFEFRYNLRKVPHLMFDLLLMAFPKPVAPLRKEVGQTAA